MERISRTKLFENELFLLEKERYQGWVSETKVISLYTKHISIDTLPEAWQKMFKEHLSGKETSLDFIFKDLIDIYKDKRKEPILIEEMIWDLRDISLNEVNSILKEDYGIPPIK